MVFLVSLSSALLLLFINISNKFLLVDLVSCNFTELFTNYKSFLVKSLGFSMYILSPANTSVFLIWMTFISLSFVTTLARTCSTTLNKIGEIRHIYLIPGLKGKPLKLSPLSIMLAMNLLFIAFIILTYILSAPKLLKIFSVKKMLHFVK